MRVRQDDRINGFRINWKVYPIALSYRLVPLEQTTIDQQSLALKFKEMA